jgi:hypothetical protein
MVRRFTALVATGALVGFGLVGLAASPAAAAATVGDETSLRAAFQDAAETAITVTADITLTCDGGGQLTRDSAIDLLVDGAGHTITQSCPDNRIMKVEGGGQLAIKDLTLTGGNAGHDESGGAIHSTARVVIDKSVLHHNVAGDHGGAVYAPTVSVSSSILHNNQAGISGGAIFAANGQVDILLSHLYDNKAATGSGGAAYTLWFWVNSSTLEGNEAGFRGGALLAFGGTHSSILNSTLSGNDAGDAGGAVATSSPLTVANTTITGNSAGAVAGGVRLFADVADMTLTLQHVTLVGNEAPVGANLAVAKEEGTAGVALVSFGTVVALPAAGGGNCALDEGVGTVSEGYNFSDGNSCGFTGGTDHENAGDPQLGALADNGGPTQTRLPATDSPLLDAIPVADCHAGIGFDQRGVDRPQGSGCDIGAVEVEVVVEDPGTPPGLPPTGTQAALVTGLAAVLLVTGAGLFVLARRRIRFTA